MAIERDVHGPFVGRTDELDSLTAVRLESHRYGRFAIVAGDAGIGKTRLVKEFLRSVPRGRAAIGVGRALEHVRAPFAPWISALQSVSPAAARAVAPNGEAFSDKAAMYAALTAALHECAQRRSTVLVLEDMHWADAASLDLLHVLAAEIAGLRRLLVIATVRAGEIDDATRTLLGKPHTFLLDLRPLPSRDCVELVRALLPDGAADSSRAERIAALSGGNPFFAGELAKNGDSEGIPLTLSSAIDARVARLDAEDVTALEAAAILGERFELQLLAEMLNADPATAAQRLDRAQRDAIVIEEGDGQFRFAHALTRAVLAKRLTSAQRITIHKRAARALERRRRFDALGFAQLAYHHAGAHDPVKAYAYRMRAGGLAYSVHGYADAASFYADAAACAERGSLEQARALARQGDALHRLPALDEAREAYSAAIAIYRAAGSIEEAARLYQSLARSLFNQDLVRDALVMIEHAVAELVPLPAELNDELSLQAAFYAADLEPQDVMRWLERIDEKAVSMTPQGGQYYQIAAAVYATLGDVEGWKRSEAAFQLNAACVQPEPAYIGHYGNLAANAMFLGIPAMALYERCFAFARTLKLEVYEAAFASHASFERWLHGDDEGFQRHAALAAAHDAPIPALRSYVMLAAILHDPAVLPDAAEVEAMIAGGRNEFFGPLTGAYARALARGGDMKGARRILDVAAQRLERPYAAWEALTAMAEFGSKTARDRAKALLEPYADSKAPAFAAAAAMVSAFCAQHEGDALRRDRFAARARDIYAEMGWLRHERTAAELGVERETEARLSGRETEIARLLQEGRSNREMAQALFISEKTVEKHLARLYEKLRVNNRAGAVRVLGQMSGE
jgi:DNA-binding CsgD family transcriptional regulator